MSMSITSRPCWQLNLLIWLLAGASPGSTGQGVGPTRQHSARTTSRRHFSRGLERTKSVSITARIHRFVSCSRGSSHQAPWSLCYGFLLAFLDLVPDNFCNHWLLITGFISHIYIERERELEIEFTCTVSVSLDI